MQEALLIVGSSGYLLHEPPYNRCHAAELTLLLYQVKGDGIGTSGFMDPINGNV